MLHIKRFQILGELSAHLSASQAALVVKNPPANTVALMEKEMATHSSVLA